MLLFRSMQPWPEAGVVPSPGGAFPRPSAAAGPSAAGSRGPPHLSTARGRNTDGQSTADAGQPASQPANERDAALTRPPSPLRPPPGLHAASVEEDVPQCSQDAAEPRSTQRPCTTAAAAAAAATSCHAPAPPARREREREPERTRERERERKREGKRESLPTAPTAKSAPHINHMEPAPDSRRAQTAHHAHDHDAAGEHGDDWEIAGDEFFQRYHFPDHVQPTKLDISSSSVDSSSDTEGPLSPTTLKGRHPLQMDQLPSPRSPAPSVAVSCPLPRPPRRQH